MTEPNCVTKGTPRGNEYEHTNRIIGVKGEGTQCPRTGNFLPGREATGRGRAGQFLGPYHELGAPAGPFDAKKCDFGEIRGKSPNLAI